MFGLLSLLCAKNFTASNAIFTRAFMVIPQKSNVSQKSSTVTNKDVENYAKVFAYLRQVYPDLDLKTFVDEESILDFFGLLAFCQTQTDRSSQLDFLVNQFKNYVQQSLQIESLADHCIQNNPDIKLSPSAISQIIDDIIRIYFFTMQYTMKIYPNVQNPPQAIIDQVRTRMQSRIRNVQIGNGILVQIPIMDKVFTKEQELEDFRKAKTIEEIEEKVNTYEMNRTKGKSPAEIENEPAYMKYGIIIKGENQPLTFPAGAPAIFQNAIDQSIAEKKAVCLEHKQTLPDGKDIEIAVCALATVNENQQMPEIPEDMVMQTAQAQAAIPFIKSVIETAKNAVHFEKAASS